MTRAPTRGCTDRRDLSAPRALVIACKCVWCEGELRSDGVNGIGTLGLLRRTACGCAYAIEVWR